MKLSDFDFDLPEERIAIRPMSPRGDAKLLVSQAGQIEDACVRDLCSYLRPGDRLVLNDTKVIPARLSGTRARQSAQGHVKAKIEVTLLEPQAGGRWKALIKPLRKLAVGEEIIFAAGLSARCVDKADGEAVLDFSAQGAELDAALDVSGQMPLPSYIASKRAADAQDHSDYQTVWAKHRGAVAAPTASLHLDAAALEALQRHGVTISYVTLHVGAGTFLPVKVEEVTAHKMHAEWGHVTPQAVAEIEQTRAAGGRIIPVGTTALRLIETAARGGSLRPFEGGYGYFHLSGV
jgi:S-adenosylmethionine:tRNA ribosyltransferase-isomerase